MKLFYLFALLISPNNIFAMDRCERDTSHFQKYLEENRQYTLAGLELLMARAQSAITDSPEIEFLSFPPQVESHVCRTECLNAMKSLKETVTHLKTALKDNSEEDAMKYIAENPEAALYTNSNEYNMLLQWARNNKPLNMILTEKFHRLANRRGKTSVEFLEN